MKAPLWLKRTGIAALGLFAVLGIALGNEFYGHTSGIPSTGSLASSASMRAEFDAIASGFDLLPTLTGNNDEAVFVNSGASGLVAQPAADARTLLGVPAATSGVLTTPTINDGTTNLDGGTLVVPQGTTPAQTAEGSVVWDTDGDLLTVGTGAGRKTLVDTDSSQTLSNKSVDLTDNTLSGTTAEFNTALSDNDFATLAGSEALTNKTVDLTSNTVTGTTAEFNAALSDNDFATLAGAETLTNKTLTAPTINDGTTSLDAGTLVLPQATAPAQTAEGSVVWDTDGDLLTVGTGAARKTLVNTDSTQTLTNKTLSGTTTNSGTISGGTLSGATLSGTTTNSGTISGGTISGITDLAVADGGTGASTAADARSNLGLGTIATQDANAVSISGGTVNATTLQEGGADAYVVGGTDVAVADGGTGASTATAARSNLGLGSIATQDANNVSITGGTVDGVTVTNAVSINVDGDVTSDKACASGFDRVAPNYCLAESLVSIGNDGACGQTTAITGVSDATAIQVQMEVVLSGSDTAGVTRTVNFQAHAPDDTACSGVRALNLNWSLEEFVATTGGSTMFKGNFGPWTIKSNANGQVVHDSGGDGSILFVAVGYYD